MTDTQMAEAIKAAVAAALAADRKGRKTKGKGRVKLSDEQLTANAAKNSNEAVQLFEKLGYKNCVAHETIKSGNRWIASGRIPVKGKGQKLPSRGKQGYSLWHLDDTTVMETPKAAVQTKH